MVIKYNWPSLVKHRNAVFCEEWTATGASHYSRTTVLCAEWVNEHTHVQRGREPGFGL